MSDPDAATLNAAQLAVIDLLGASADGRADFGEPHELARHLEHELAAGLAPLLDELPDGDDLWLAKHAIASVHGCEARFLADEADPFAWTAPLARGTVAHKAIELSAHWRGQLIPLELVDEAMASLSHSDNSLGDFLRTMSITEAAELRSLVNDRVATFLQCFPPLKPQWIPVTESKVRVELFDGRITLGGKVDLTLGRAEGRAAKGKVLIDFKTGGFQSAHLDDLRFYALLETIKFGVPPRLVASYYLESARPWPETITSGVLEAALARTVDAAIRLVELRFGGRAATRRPGPPCRWCRLQPECVEGTAHLRGNDDDEPFEDDDR
jgi:hypothetical protein